MLATQISSKRLPVEEDRSGTRSTSVLRDARQWRAPQDEDIFRGEIPHPHGEGVAKPRVSNHEARNGCQRKASVTWWRGLLPAAALWLASAAPACAFIAYVSNEKGNTVSVIDTDSWAVTRTIKVGQRPRGIEFTRDGKFVMVAVGDDDTIQVIDTGKQEVVDTLPSGPDPELFAQDAAGKMLYVANENDNTVTVLDLGKRARVGDIQVGVEPEGMTVSPDGKILINTSETTNMAHFIDTATRQIVANVLVDARPRFAEFKRDGSELWVSSEIGGTVSIIDPAKREVTGKITFTVPGLRSEAIQPVGIAITKDGKTGFVALGPANRVAVIDTASHEVRKYLLVGQRVWHMAFTPDEKYLLVTNGVSNDVSVIDVAAQKVIKTIQVGELPWGITIAQP
jgi:PQQ-dependent catabolism-associated beta-propeller protein